MKAIEKIMQELNSKGIKPSKVESDLSLSNGYLANMNKRKSNLGEEVLIKLANYLDFSLDDLLLSNTGIQKPENRVKKLKDLERKMDGMKPIPLLPVDAFAGISSQTDYSVEFNAIEDNYVVPLFSGKQVDFMINIKGSSMYPKYSSGDVVACKFIAERLYIQWNKVYVVDTISQGTMVKRLRRSNKPNHITFRSDNKEYEDFDVPEKDIRNIALVIGVIRLE